MARDNKSTTDLGTDQIHKRHKVMIEGGKVPRAQVMDQMMIDRYLVEGILTLAQHQAGEYILNQASKAGVYARPQNWGEPRGCDAQGSGCSEALLRFGKTMRVIKDRMGEYAGYIVEEVVCHNMDVSQHGDRLRILRDGLDLIVNNRMAGGRNPMRHLRK